MGDTHKESYAESEERYVPCPLCGESKYRKIYKERGTLGIVKCLGCGLVQLDNISAMFDVKNYEYYKNRINMKPQELYNPLTTKRYIDLLRKFECYRENNALLDIGCGQGQFLSVAKSMHWQIEGIEIAPYAVEICNKFKLNAICGDFLELDLKNNYYDIITMSEVLEHITQPKKYLLKINHVLRRGGVFFFTTPNFNSLTRILLQNKWRLIHKEHLFYFTPVSIKKLLDQVNFKIIEFKIKDITLPELYNLFINRPASQIFDCNQNLRNTIEENRNLLFLKEVANKFLNITRLGESMQCICQKI